MLSFTDQIHEYIYLPVGKIKKCSQFTFVLAVDPNSKFHVLVYYQLSGEIGRERWGYKGGRTVRERERQVETGRWGDRGREREHSTIHYANVYSSGHFLNKYINQ